MFCLLLLQSLWRAKAARRELRQRRTEAREAGKLLQDKQALEVRLREVQNVLETVQNQRNELRQQYRVSGCASADLSMWHTYRVSASRGPPSNLCSVSASCALQEEKAQREVADLRVVELQSALESQVQQAQAVGAAAAAAEVAQRQALEADLAASRRQVATSAEAAAAAQQQLASEVEELNLKLLSLQRQASEAEVGCWGQTCGRRVHRAMMLRNIDGSGCPRRRPKRKQSGRIC